jgi:hypothetical protein
MDSRLTTPASGVVALADRLSDWVAIEGAFAANTIRAWRADWRFLPRAVGCFGWSLWHENGFFRGEEGGVQAAKDQGKV